MKRINTLVISALAVCSFSSTAYADTILHAFNWKYSDVTANADKIAQVGYKKVLVAPAMKSSGTEWWARYQPQDLRTIDSPLGNKQDLVAMIAALKAVGVDVYADVVLNHMANESWKRSDLNYPGTEVLNDYANRFSYFAEQTLFGNIAQGFVSDSDFHPPGCITDWNDPGHVQYWRLCGAEGDAGLPDLDPNNWVVSQQRLYLEALKNMGIKGFRIDAVKHMSQYQINQIFTSDIISDMHVFGEVITSGGVGNSGYESFLAPYLNNTNHSAYDFPLFASIRSAFSIDGGLNQLHDPKAYGQALDENRSITFTITHDIPTNDGFRYQIMDSQDEQLAYAYILGKDGGTPLIYSDDLPDSEDKDKGRWSNIWNSSTMVNMLSFHNAMQGKAMDVIASDQCILLFKRGKEGVVGINKCGETQGVTVDTYEYEFNWNIQYKDVLSNTTEVITSRYHTFYLPPRSAQMLML